MKIIIGTICLILLVLHGNCDIFPGESIIKSILSPVKAIVNALNPLGASGTKKQTVSLEHFKNVDLNTAADLLQGMDDAELPVHGLIKKYGYPCENHAVKTEDGYMITMQRIPYGKRDWPSRYRPVVLLAHGILASATDWVIVGPDRALAYILADNGYDVWLYNARGNTYSRLHVNYQTEDKRYWDFTFHEMGVYDLPAVIDYILEETEQMTLFYVGYSLGTTIFYVLCSELPEYNKKIAAQISMSPMAYMKHITNPALRIMAHFNGPLSFITGMVGLQEFMPSNSFFELAGKTLCSGSGLTMFLCTNPIFLYSGYNPKQLNTNILPVVMSHTPAGTSVNTIFHYAQLVVSGMFCKWDYGYEDNDKKYDIPIAPIYRLEKVTVPVYLFYSDNDFMSNPKDVKTLYKQLGNPRIMYRVLDENWSNIDYIYGLDAPRLIYRRILDILIKEQYSGMIIL